MLRKTPATVRPILNRPYSLRRFSGSRMDVVVPNDKAQDAVLDSIPPRRNRETAEPRAQAADASSVSLPPHTISETTWRLIHRGVQQRFAAINLFLTETLAHGVRSSLVDACPYVARLVSGVAKLLTGTEPTIGTWTWLASTDLYLPDGQSPVVLDHNFACPVGLHRLSELLAPLHLAHNVDDWLRSRLHFRNGQWRDERTSPRVAILDSGSFSSAYREDTYLATQFGGDVVRNRDLSVDSNGLFVLRHGQAERIDLLIRRVVDESLDPNCFRPDSLNGVPGLVRACRQRSVGVLNAPGMGMVNNRAVAMLIPKFIRHYLSESPVLDSVATLICADDVSRAEVLSSPQRFAIRTIDPLHPARPYFGATATAAETAEIISRISGNPENYVARPLLSSCGDTSCVSASGGMNLRIFCGESDGFSALPFGIGRPAQPDGGATVAIHCDEAVFAVAAEGGT